MTDYIPESLNVSVVFALLVCASAAGFLTGNVLASPGMFAPDDGQDGTPTVECSVHTGDAPMVVCTTTGDVNLNIDTPESWERVKPEGHGDG